MLFSGKSKVENLKKIGQKWSKIAEIKFWVKIRISIFSGKVYYRLAPVCMRRIRLQEGFKALAGNSPEMSDFLVTEMVTLRIHGMPLMSSNIILRHGVKFVDFIMYC